MCVYIHISRTSVRGTVLILIFTIVYSWFAVEGESNLRDLSYCRLQHIVLGIQLRGDADFDTF